MIKRRRLGQHFLTSASIAESIVSEAKITKNDTVFEVGTGRGILTPLLCQRAARVISVDLDEQLIRDARSRFSDVDNLVLKSGDGLKSKDTFSIFVSNLPYSRSKDAIEWLAQTPFSHGIIMVQKEFAEKLLASSSKQRKAVSIIAASAFEMTISSQVGRNNFSPRPKIDSVVLKITQKSRLSRELVQTINRIFSYRRKTVKNILKQFDKESDVDKRIDDLTVREIVDLAGKILQ